MSQLAVGYCRVSTDEQANSGISLEAQRAKIALYAQLHNLELVTIETDPGASGKSLERPGLARALEALEQGRATILVIAKLDRLSRSIGDWQYLIERYFGDQTGKRLMSVADSIDTRSPGGRLVLNVLMGVAQWERETIVERTRGAMAFKRSRGQRVGSVPFGSNLSADGRTLEPNPTEQDVISRMRGWKAAGRSLRQIAAELSSRGITPKKGPGRWAHSAVSSILNRATAAPGPT